MSDLITIPEYEDWSGPLSNDDWDFISSELNRQFVLRKEVRDGKTICVLNPNQYVGLIMLPSGTRLQIVPKVPIANLFYMISIVCNLPWAFREEFAKLEQFEEILSIIAQVFSELVEERINSGLYRSYLEKEE